MLTQYYCYVMSHNLFFFPQIAGTMLLVKEVSGNVEMELRKEDANWIVRRKWKAKDLRKTDHRNGIGNGKWKWNKKMENGNGKNCRQCSITQDTLYGFGC